MSEWIAVIVAEGIFLIGLGWLNMRLTRACRSLAEKRQDWRNGFQQFRKQLKQARKGMANLERNPWPSLPLPLAWTRHWGWRVIRTAWFVAGRLPLKPSG